jgi:D-ribose pyranase
MKRTRLPEQRTQPRDRQDRAYGLHHLCDAGLPIPGGVRRIDLAIERGYPSFVRTLDALLSELMVEEIVVAGEIRTKNPGLFRDMMAVFRDHEMEPVVTEVPHDEFKQLTRSSESIVLTGECTPYANVILKSGVAFRVPDPQSQSSQTRPVP